MVANSAPHRWMPEKKHSHNTFPPNVKNHIINLPCHHIPFWRGPLEQYKLEFQQLILALNATGTTAIAGENYEHLSDPYGDNMSIYVIQQNTSTFEYPKSHIFKRGAALPSRRVFSSFRSLWHICCRGNGNLKKTKLP